MSGIQEILLLILLALAIFAVPRLFKRGGRRSGGRTRSGAGLSGRMRLALLLSVAWPLSVGLFRNPLAGSPQAFFYIGIVPVLLAWGLAWVAAGFRRRPERKNK